MMMPQHLQHEPQPPRRRVSLTNPRRQQQQHRRVSFSETSEMVLVTDLSRSPDKDRIWFTPDELESFKSNMSGYIRLVRLHIAKRHAPSASNILGLEKFLTVQLTEEYKYRRGKLAREVVEECCRRSQYSSASESEDVDRLARISAENSKWARERARAAALFLEQDQEAERLRDQEALLRRNSLPADVEVSSGQDEERASLQVQGRMRRRTSLQETKRVRTTSKASSSSQAPEPVCMEIDGSSNLRFIRTVSPALR